MNPVCELLAGAAGIKVFLIMTCLPLCETHFPLRGDILRGDRPCGAVLALENYSED